MRRRPRYQPRDYRGRFVHNGRPRRRSSFWGPFFIFLLLVLLFVLAGC